MPTTLEKQRYDEGFNLHSTFWDIYLNLTLFVIGTKSQPFDKSSEYVFEGINVPKPSSTLKGQSFLLQMARFKSIQAGEWRWYTSPYEWVEALKSQDQETPEIWDTKTKLMKETGSNMLKLVIDYQLHKLLTPIQINLVPERATTYPHKFYAWKLPVTYLFMLSRRRSWKKGQFCDRSQQSNHLLAAEPSRTFLIYICQCWKI